MHIIAPHISCVVNEEEFPQVITQNYSEIYVTSRTGKIYKHTKLSRGRHVRVEVRDIPGYTALPTEMEEEINFLPAGKISISLLEEIIQFFKDVMSIKKAEQEAMAHILWNREKGYHIAIPNQIVSKASVKYEFDHIKAGDIIVVDIHSHNTMGAFFSGTDDGDDRKGIYYSGVVGKLDEPVPALVWRFNVNEVKKTASLEDIFDVPKREIKIPEDWLNKVQVGQSYRPYTGGNHFPSQGVLEFLGKSERAAFQRRSGESSKSLIESGPELSADDLRFDPESGAVYGYGIPGLEDDLLDDADLQKLSPKDRNALGLSAQGREVDHSVLVVDDELAADIMMYGHEAAEAAQNVALWLDDLEGQDEILTRIMMMCYGMMSAEAQGQLVHKGFN